MNNILIGNGFDIEIGGAKECSNAAIIERVHKNIENKDYIRYCYNICRSHHEKWDGSGFPDRLVGDDIPICAQAVGLAHSYDEMIVSKGYTHEQAVERIHDGVFHSFSPVLVETFQLVADDFRLILEKNPESEK